MADADETWLSSGPGDPPRARWAFGVDGRLLRLAFARESEEALAADDAGGLYLIDPDGRPRQLTRGLPEVSAVALADTGACAAVAYDDRRVALLDRSLATAWSMTLYDTVVGVALDPFGRYLAVALANRDVRVYTTAKTRVAAFEAVRPVRFLAFATTRPLLLGAADHGLLAAWTVSGKEVWDARLFTACGDMVTAGDGGTLYVAAFAHGVQRFDGAGTNRGTLVVEGTPARLAASFDGGRIGVGTLERQLYRLDRNGNLLWAATTPDDLAALCGDGSGRSLLVGFTEGRVVRLDWPDPAPRIADEGEPPA